MDDQSTGFAAIKRATSLFDLISSEAAASERLGRLTDTTTAALLEAKLFSIMVPQRDGGLGGGHADYFQTVETIARADGSAGWCASVCNAINHTAALALPQDGREEVFGQGPVSCWASLQPNAAATAVTGGYRVSSPGTFGSGSSFSSWVLIASNLGAAGEGRYRAYLIPKAETQIKPGSWDVMGLRATASVDYSVSERFVPARRTWEYDWTSSSQSGPLSATQSVRLNAIGLAAFASGVAQRALGELIASASKTKRTAAQGVQADDNAVQLGVGELDGRLRAARAHLAGLVAAMEARAAEGPATSFEEGIEVMQACQTLARASRDMVVFAFDNAGASVVYARQPLQRCLRDIFTGLKHASFTPALLGRIGKVRLGMPFGGTAL